MPATCVPCPKESSAAASATQVPETQFAPEPVRTRPSARSGFVVSTPESTIPTIGPPVTPYEPGNARQPPSAPIVESAHCEPYEGSLGGARSA
jgi:hypothetical protein